MGHLECYHELIAGITVLLQLLLTAVPQKFFSLQSWARYTLPGTC